MNGFRVELPPNVAELLTCLARAGHRGYLVGGSLRDMLLGGTPHDMDLTTDATPDEMQEIFRDYRTIPTGLKHGTLTVLAGGEAVEITTHRTDGAYSDSRHPQSVSFTARLEEDLSRRDFTVNAMAWSRETGLVDLFGGQEDLKRRRLRAVGDAKTRFTEDALRILRLFRFMSQLDFEAEEQTLQGAMEARAGLARISAERIFSECTRLLTGQAAERGMNALMETECAPFVFGALCPDGAAIGGLHLLPPQAELRFASLFRAPLQEVEELCRALRTSNAFSRKVCGILDAAGEPLPKNEYEARRFVCGHFYEWQDALLLSAARGADTARAAELCRQVVRDRTAVDLPRLAVNGKELQEKAGVDPRQTAWLLRRLQDAVWHDPLLNKKQLLLARATEILREET